MGFVLDDCGRLFYIKILMILFLAPPILFYLAISPQSPLFNLSYLLPSSATFYALMDLLNNQPDRLSLNLFILFVHAILWSVADKIISRRKGMSCEGFICMQIREVIRADAALPIKPNR